MQVNRRGVMVSNTWNGLPTRFPGVMIDAFVVMPNHVDGVVMLGAVVDDRVETPVFPDLAHDREAPGAMNRAATKIDPNPLPPESPDPLGVAGRFIAPVPPEPAPQPEDATRSILVQPTLGEVIRAFKAVSTRLIRTGGFASFAWQRNYHDHIVRNARDLERIRLYVDGNPGRWEGDDEHPDRVGGLR